MKSKFNTAKDLLKSPHPTDFIHGILSSHVYENFKKGHNVTFSKAAKSEK